jgi:Amt family ammonium transporter
MVFVAKPIFNFFGKEDGSVFDPNMLISCQISGLVSISASCNCVSTQTSLVIGAIGAILFMFSKRILNRLEIDDPLNVTSIHLVCGVWGLISAGLFADTKGLVNQNNSTLIFSQLIGAAAIFTWAAVISFVFFYGLQWLHILRIGEVLEVVGLDYHEINLIDRNDHID